MMNIEKNCVIIVFILLLFSFILGACQPTPEDAIVSQKGDLTDKIAETADPGQAPTGVGSHYSLEKTFEQSGHTLIVDANITGGDESKMAVLTVAEKPFESGDSLKKIVEDLFSNSMIKNYSEYTKGDLEYGIKEAELMIFRIKNHLNTQTGEPLKKNEQQPIYLPESLIGKDISNMTDLEIMEIYLEELKQKYTRAPRDEDLDDPNFIIKSDGEISYNTLRVKKGDLIYKIDIVNRNEGELGSYFAVYRMNNLFLEDKELPVASTSFSELKDSVELQQVKQLLQNLGIDYMELYEVYQGENACKYVFTRSYNGAQEDYVGEYLGLSVTDGDGVQVQRLWKPEYFSIIMNNGEIEDIYWKNPSQIVKVDNENVKILPWSEIQKIFEKQMEFLLTPSSEGGDSMFWWKPSDIKIERITLGLAKMLMKDSGEYKLIPVWNFFGRDNSNSDMEDAEEKCYVTINALDGTIMDRDVMY